MGVEYGPRPGRNMFGVWVRMDHWMKDIQSRRTKQYHLFSEGDSMYSRHVVLEMHDIAEDQPVRLAHWMAASNRLTYWFLA